MIATVQWICRRPITQKSQLCKSVDFWGPVEVSSPSSLFSHTPFCWLEQDNNTVADCSRTNINWLHYPIRDRFLLQVTSSSLPLTSATVQWYCRWSIKRKSQLCTSVDFWAPANVSSHLSLFYLMNLTKSIFHWSLSFSLLIATVRWYCSWLFEENGQLIVLPYEG